MLRVQIRAALGLSLLLGLAASPLACGGARASFDGATFRDGAIAFRVPPPPPTWRRIDMADATLAFRDDAHDASILLNARCQARQADAPLAALTNHLLAGTTERVVSLEETIPLDGREALHSRLHAKLDGVRMAYDIYVLKKDGCVYDFVWVASPSASTDDGLAPFEAFVMGFRTAPGAGSAGSEGGR